MTPPPALIEDAITEILLRVPPDDPASLVRCSVVCKHWHLLLTDPAFLRRYRAFHRTPPMLGFLDGSTAAFVPTTSFRPRHSDHPGWCVVDSHHGRVLFYCPPSRRARNSGRRFIVWDPITDSQWTIPLPEPSDILWTAAVLCATDGCEHLDCHGDPFCVAFVNKGGYEDEDEGLMFARVYLSEAGAWGDATCVEIDAQLILSPSVLVGKKAYFSCYGYYVGTGILEYNICEQELSVIDPPLPDLERSDTVLVKAENGELGFVAVQESKLHMWSRELHPNGAMAWAECRVIEHEIVRPIRGSNTPNLVGFAEGVNAIFVWTCAGIFTIVLKSGRVQKVFNRGRTNATLIPYVSFYTPGSSLPSCIS